VRALFSPTVLVLHNCRGLFPVVAAISLEPCFQLVHILFHSFGFSPLFLEFFLKLF